LKRLVYFLLVLGIAILGGCYYDNAEDLYGVDDQCAEPATQVYKWGDDVRPVVLANCATSGCHQAGNGGGRQVLESDEDMKNAFENYDLRRRVEEGSMPPSGSFAPCDKQAILSWIEQNFPNN